MIPQAVPQDLWLNTVEHNARFLTVIPFTKFTCELLQKLLLSLLNKLRSELQNKLLNELLMIRCMVCCNDLLQQLRARTRMWSTPTTISLQWRQGRFRAIIYPTTHPTNSTKVLTTIHRCDVCCVGCGVNYAPAHACGVRRGVVHTMAPWMNFMPWVTQQLNVMNSIPFQWILCHSHWQ